MNNKEQNKKTKNPFTPNFGQIPVKMAGRSEIIDEFEYALDNAPGDPALTTIIIGARGTGKTALLSYMAHRAEEYGWISVNVACVTDMLEDIYQQTIKNSEHLLMQGRKSVKSSLGISLGLINANFSFENEGEYSQNWRIRMTELISRLNENDIGLLITIDEINASAEELKKFASIYQMFIREERKVALVMAGLPHNVSALLNSEENSFLRRANQKHIGTVPDYEIYDAFVKTIRIGGRDVTEDAAACAVNIIDGFPYMLQLLGYRAWKESESNKTISKDDILEGSKLAIMDIKTRVLKRSLDEISDMGIKVLKAMREDKEYSLLPEIAKRTGKTTSYLSNYKNILCEYGLIEDTGRGKLKYSIPGLREYLDEYEL